MNNAHATVSLKSVYFKNDKWSKNITKGRIAWRAVIKDWMIPFAAYTSAETPNAFQLAGQPPKTAYLDHI